MNDVTLASGWWCGYNTLLTESFNCKNTLITNVSPNNVITGSIGTIMVKHVVRMPYVGKICNISQSLSVTPDTMLKIYDMDSMGTHLNGIEIRALDFMQTYGIGTLDDYSGYVYNIVAIDAQRTRLDHEALFCIDCKDIKMRISVPTLGIKYDSESYKKSDCYGDSTVMEFISQSARENPNAVITVNREEKHGNEN